MHSPMESYEPLGDAGMAAVSRCLVFVVEDEEDIARLISHNLQAAGFDVQASSAAGLWFRKRCERCHHFSFWT